MQLRPILALTGKAAILLALLLLRSSMAAASASPCTNSHCLTDIEVKSSEAVLLTLFDMNEKYEPKIVAFNKEMKPVYIQVVNLTSSGGRKSLAVVPRPGTTLPITMLAIRYLYHDQYHPVKSCAYTVVKYDAGSANLEALIAAWTKDTLEAISIAPRDPLAGTIPDITIKFPVYDSLSTIRLETMTTDNKLKWKSDPIRSLIKRGTDSEGWSLSDETGERLPAGTYRLVYHDTSMGKHASMIMTILKK